MTHHVSYRPPVQKKVAVHRPAGDSDDDAQDEGSSDNTVFVPLFSHQTNLISLFLQWFINYIETMYCCTISKSIEIPKF